MKITEELKKSHGELSDCGVKFLDFVEKNPGSLKFSNYDLLELNDPLFKLQPWPTFINEAVKNEFKEASVSVLELLRSIPSRIFNGDFQKMSQYYDLPLDIIKFQMGGVDDSHVESVLARGDFLYSPEGLKCLEYNITANLGGWTVPLWESLYLKTPIIKTFLEDYSVKIINMNLIGNLFDHLIDIALEKLKPAKGEINIALLVMEEESRDQNAYMEMYLNELYRTCLARKKRNLVGKIMFCYANDLVNLKEQLYCDGKSIQILIEMLHGVISPEIMKVFAAGNLCLYNGPVTNLLSNKLNLALLSDTANAELFSDEEKEIIDKYIPWTRKIEPCTTVYRDKKVDLMDFVLTNREKLVIKPGEGYGGAGVCIGIKSSQEEWEQIIEGMGNQQWLVQEYAESIPMLYQSGDDGCSLHDAVWGFFVLGSEYAGGWVRVMPRDSNAGVINCHQGAKVSVIFEVEE